LTLLGTLLTIYALYLAWAYRPDSSAPASTT
jgi:hypothetical protein